MTVRELCEQYIADMEAGLVLGKGGRPKKATTVATDIGRIRRHIIPLLGTRRIKDIAKPDMNNLMKDIIAGKLPERQCRSRSSFVLWQPQSGGADRSCVP